jgi:catechol 2,3-dioxygenase-like lactoylglutathione lyase family enzyme
MTTTAAFTLTTVNLSAPDPRTLADFYQTLLGWDRGADEPGWVTLHPPGGGIGLAFQPEPGYRPPIWPARPGEQQMMVHLEIRVGELADAVARAVQLGARLADYQPQDDVRVCLDPAGHPFCLWTEI